MKTLILLLLISIGTQAQKTGTIDGHILFSICDEDTAFYDKETHESWVKYADPIQNKYCEERGHILKDSISMSTSKASYILDTEDYTIRVTQKGYEFHCKCERCGEVVVIKPEPKRDTLWRMAEKKIVTMRPIDDISLVKDAYCPKCGSYLVDSYPKNITYLNDKLIRREVRCVSCDYKGYIKR